MDTQERKLRREKRLQSLKDCQTPTDVAYNIWTKELDEYVNAEFGYQKRKLIVDWIESYKLKRTPQWSSYKTPSDLAYGIWKPCLDQLDDYGLFSDLRNTLVDWIEQYVQSSQTE